MRVIESFAKGLRVLEYALKRGEFRIGEMAAAVGIASSNATLFLNTLIEAGMLRRGETTGVYRVTKRLIQLFDESGPTLHDPLRTAASESMKRLHELLNENVLLAVIDHDNSTHYIARLVADHVVRIQPDADEHYPVHRTAHGRAILAFMPEDQAAEVILAGSSGDHPEALGQLESELATIRHRGFAVNRGDYEEHIMAIAAPVRLGERVVASVVVQLPKFRHDESDLDRYGERVSEAAQSISSRLDALL
jgi:IclR family acetate operon transcriptional repressor